MSIIKATAWQKALRWLFAFVVASENEKCLVGGHFYYNKNVGDAKESV